MTAKSFGIVAVVQGGALLLDSHPACGDATAETCVAAAQGLELVSHA